MMCIEVTAGSLAPRREPLVLPLDPGQVEKALCRPSSHPENLTATDQALFLTVLQGQDASPHLSLLIF